MLHVWVFELIVWTVYFRKTLWFYFSAGWSHITYHNKFHCIIITLVFIHFHLLNVQFYEHLSVRIITTYLMIYGHVVFSDFNMVIALVFTCMLFK